MNKKEPEKLTIELSNIRRLLEQGQHHYWQKLNERLIEDIVTQFKLWPQVTAPYVEPGLSQDGSTALHIVRFLAYEVAQSQKILERIKLRNNEYTQRYAKAVSEDEKTKLILEYARDLGANARQLRGDKKAFSRWFGHDVLSDRYQHCYLNSERYLSFVLQSLGRMAAIAIHENGPIIGYLPFWSRLALEAAITPLLSYDGDERVVAAAFHSLVDSLDAMPQDMQHQCLTESSLRFIYHACLKSSQSVWVQCEALQLLHSASSENMFAILTKRLQHPLADDDLFVRRKVIDIIGQRFSFDTQMKTLVAIALKDPSPSVRQKIAEALNQAEKSVVEQHYPALLFDDPVEQVRASTLLNLNSLMLREDCLTLALQYLEKSLNTEQHRFTLRVALKVCRDGLEGQVNKENYTSRMLPAVDRLHQQADDIAVRRWAAQTREYLICFGHEKTAEQIKALQQFVNTIPPGKTRRIPKDLKFQGENQFELGRLLSVIAQQDFGFDIEQGMFGSFITRGHVFGFRLWRLFHEFRHPSPDKRQAFQHTRGRLFWGTIRIPSAILSELSETKVPGEPLYLDTEDGWRGYLPLVDEVISALAIGHQSTWFYHSEGITQLQPPSSFMSRCLASWRISYYFSEYARLRNWQEKNQDSPHAYLEKLTSLGVKITIHNHGSDFSEATEDPSVLRFFPLTFPMADGQVWQGFKDYFVSVYENTLYELSVFLGVIITFFVGRHLYLYQKIKKARNKIPLVLGGWGTRGKSGTERIKAALINALGYSIVSKTTGCEAMFLHAHPYGELREMFLFRPYDKATIWEQHNLVCLSGKLKCEVYLWECMGLTPSYVDVLQRQWMNDDISTITNTFPDHEDIQGPAGINIPEVMTQFIPEHSTLLTTEEQMMPILKASALKKNTNFRSISWLEAGLLADDVLDRFPYEEHPYNIALVIAMGEELGVESDFALKEMADRVVADIGVLKTFPCALIRSRRLEFINGMSANERYGCLSNWQRMGLDKVQMDKQSDTWITIVVNNRADRIPRSRVFASIIVKDISFDRCVLIGNNLMGMLGYIKESWEEWIESISLKSDGASAQDILLQMAERFRVPYSKHILEQQFLAMLQGQQSDIDNAEFLELMHQPVLLEQKMLGCELSNYQEILQFLKQGQFLLSSYEKFLSIIQQSDAINSSLDVKFHNLLWQWFEHKLIIIKDQHATGNQIIDKICDVTPPGFYNRILGMQNIKGTGLDFVYRWQAWETNYKACMQLLSTSRVESERGLMTLASCQEYGCLDTETVLSAIEMVKVSAFAQNEHYQEELGVIQANIEQSVIQLEKSNKLATKSNSWVVTLSQGIEAFLDAGDAVKRRKLADQIYQDLVDERISHVRATLELQAINKRQKGGWFNILK